MSSSPQRTSRPCTPTSPRRHASRSPPPARAQQPSQLEELTNMMTQLTRNVARMAQQPQQPTIPPVEAEPAFDWAKLLQPMVDFFPQASEGQVQRIATGLLAKLPLLTGRDHHEVAFILTMLSDYPNLLEILANRLYQKANLLYIAVYHGWATAIAATNTLASSAAVFPPGFQPPPPPTRRPFPQQPTRTPTTQPIRARGRGRRRGPPTTVA